MAFNTEIRGLEVFDSKTFEQKLRRFGTAGLDSVHAVFDFDLTLTSPGNNGERVSSWSLLESHLPPELRFQCDELYEKYYHREREGVLTVEEAEIWWSQALKLHKQAGTDLREVEKNFMGASNVRPGVSKTFEFLKKLDVPAVILSAGVKNVIDLWCAAYNIEPTVVISTELEIDENDCVIGWDESSVVHSLNKAENAHPELKRLRMQRPNVIAVGDSMGDADMAHGEEGVLRIRVVDDYADHVHSADIRSATATRFDAMIKDGDFIPVYALANRIDAINDAQ